MITTSCTSITGCGISARITSCTRPRAARCRPISLTLHLGGPSHYYRGGRAGQDRANPGRPGPGLPARPRSLTDVQGWHRPASRSNSLPPVNCSLVSSWSAERRRRRALTTTIYPALQPSPPACRVSTLQLPWLFRVRDGWHFSRGRAAGDITAGVVGRSSRVMRRGTHRSRPRDGDRWRISNGVDMVGDGGARWSHCAMLSCNLSARCSTWDTGTVLCSYVVYFILNILFLCYLDLKWFWSEI